MTPRRSLPLGILIHKELLEQKRRKIMVNRLALDVSLNYIREIDSAGELPLDSRRRLKESLLSHLLDGDRLKFVVLLGMACAKRVWPVWRSTFPLEFRPMRVAEEVVFNIKDAATPITGRTETEVVAVKTCLENKFPLGPDFFPAIYAGFACWAVARDATFGVPEIGVNEGSELKIPAEDWDPCFFASLAAAEGAVWEGGEGSDVRREFWRWYLDSAVPEAFTEAVKEPRGEDRPSSSTQDPLF